VAGDRRASRQREITREQLNLPQDRIIDGVSPARSGVVRIADLQAKDYAYLKKGSSAKLKYH
jgi:hypothetical protein